MQIVTVFPFGSRLDVCFWYAGGCGLELVLIIAHCAEDSKQVESLKGDVGRSRNLRPNLGHYRKKGSRSEHSPATTEPEVVIPAGWVAPEAERCANDPGKKVPGPAAQNA